MKFFPDFDFYVAIIIYLFEGVNLIYDNLLFLLKIFICYFVLVLTSFFLFLFLNLLLVLYFSFNLIILNFMEINSCMI